LIDTACRPKGLPARVKVRLRSFQRADGMDGRSGTGGDVAAMVVELASDDGEPQ
jgi:hypothetical protein